MRIWRRSRNHGKGQPRKKKTVTTEHTEYTEQTEEEGSRQAKEPAALLGLLPLLCSFCLLLLSSSVLFRVFCATTVRFLRNWRRIYAASAEREAVSARRAASTAVTSSRPG